ncbi:hypothetical protein [Streptomyces sp. NPDC053048]|uniref:hypothetical protein n=1 Tax=Streptomyces sp. NPDC053048 TaxID=3365694 RepID=UPI0037D1FA74
MSRPTPAQIAYGSATVVLSTLAMLLLTRASSVLGVALIALVALALGLVVAALVPVPRKHALADAPLPEPRTPAHAGSAAGER